MKINLPELPESVLLEIFSPSVIVCRDRVRANIDEMIRVAGSVDRLRPHCKTHKMADVVRMLLNRGISKHKAATIAESEMLADAGARDVMLAYNPVGPNIGRMVRLAKRFRDCLFSVTCDHEKPLRQLSAALSNEPGLIIGVFLDINPGLNRTGVLPESDDALRLYSLISELPGIRPAGFHVYDGQHRQASLDERRVAVKKEFDRAVAFRGRCLAAGLKVPAMVCGGTPTFPVYAESTEEGVELSPGTIIFHDAGYGNAFPDLNFQPAAFTLTRVISRPAADRLTLDLGNKAVAADPPKGNRVFFPELPDAVQDLHNEEHLALITPDAGRYQPGDVVLGIPMHVCPTSALHASVTVIDDGRIVSEWPVTSRNRRITI
ncbi:MAG: D-TA family PLP-dependent enzyme [Planctomyces sp.]